MPVTNKTLALAAQLRSDIEVYTTAAERTLTSQWVAAWGELNREWEDAFSQIIAARSAGRPYNPGQIIQLARVQRALVLTAQKLKELQDGLGPTVEETVRLVTNHTAEVTSQIVGSTLPEGPLYQGFTRVDPGALAAIVDRTLEQITATSWSLAEDATMAVRTSLIRAVPSGWGPDEAAREMIRRTRSSFNGGLTRAMTIARTEMLDAHRSASRAQYEASDVVTGWTWLTKLSDRTCPSCIGMHGQEFPLDHPGPEDHPNGRCTSVPTTKSWKDLGIDLEEPADEFPSVQDWMQQDPEDAILALGAKRYLMLMDGSVKLEDLATRKSNPGWRPSYQVTPLSKLRRSES